MLLAILIGFFAAFSQLLFGKFMKGKLSILLSFVPLALFIFFTQYIPVIAAGEIVTAKHSWVPSFGVNLDLKLDGLALLFSLMITGIGTLVFVYTSAYLRNHPMLDRFYGYLFIFMASMLGLVLSDNFLAMFIFWELTSISSFFLIGFNNTNPDSRKSALTALSITGIGGLLFLAGGLLLGEVTGTYQISQMLSQNELLVNHSLYILIVALIFGAAFTKSAQFPFHFWLPGAMKAPTPVSTYLHSATMVKAGIYLLFRLSPVLGNSDFWNNTLLIVGGITMLYAAFHTLFRTDLKGILAYSTIAALGILTFLIGLGTKESFIAAAVFILVHALYKATLFLMTGAIDLYTGTRDVTKLSGLHKVMLPIAIAGGLAAISNAGIPPSVGFLGKDLIYESTLHFRHNAVLLTTLAILTNILIGYAGYVAGIKPFIGRTPTGLENVTFPHPAIWIPPIILGVLGFIFGLFPSLIEASLIKPIVATTGVSTSDIHLKLWHGFNTVLGLSAITIFSGIALYFIWKPNSSKQYFIQRFDILSPKFIIETLTNWFQSFSDLWTRIFQNGYLRNYITVIVVFLISLVAFTLLNNTTYQIDYSSFSKLTIYEVVSLCIMILAIGFAVFTKSRLAAVAATGVMGYSICLFFVFYSAPDLAMTQFAIDTLTVILFVLVLYKLPRYLNLSDYKTRIKDGIIAIAFGGLVSILALEVLAQPQNNEISSYYAENAYVLAHGKNVVNVILVDFRGIDTMVEISVLAIAAIGVFGLLKLRLKSEERKQQ